MTHFEAYLLTRLDSFSNLFHVLTLISGVALMIIGFACLIASVEDVMNNQTRNKCFGIMKFFLLPTFILSLSLNSFIPTTKEAAFIYIAPAIVNNKDIQKILLT